VLGRKPATNVGSGARKNCDAESVLADRLRTDFDDEPREYSIAW
jgi:hypothetical protein